MTPANKSPRTLMRIAALFNLAAVILLGPLQHLTLPMLGMDPVVNTAFLHLFLALVLFFGVGYYLAGHDFAANRSIIVLGIWAKLSVALLVIVHAALGNISWGVAAFGQGDLLFAILFIRTLKQQTVPGK